MLYHEAVYTRNIPKLDFTKVCRPPLTTFSDGMKHYISYQECLLVEPTATPFHRFLELLIPVISSNHGLIHESEGTCAFCRVYADIHSPRRTG